MIDWMVRAKTLLAQPLPTPTVKTDETRVLSVSSVGLAANSEVDGDVSSVSSAPSDRVCEPSPAPGNPYLTVEQANECHACGWSYGEIALFLARVSRITQVRMDDAEYLAERLTLRDRQHDDRRLCLECAALSDNGRCLVAARGAPPGIELPLEPVSTILQRCPCFKVAPGLS